MTSKLQKRIDKGFSDFVEKRLPLQESVTLNQSRIFIVPTWQGLLLLVVALLVLLIAINFESALNFALGFWLISMLWIAVHLTYRNLSGLTVIADSGSLVKVGEIAEVRLKIVSKPERNRGVIEFINEHWGIVHKSIDKEEQLVSLPILATERGPVVPPRFKIESRFPFGLVMAWSHLSIDARGWAYPSPVKQDRRALNGLDDEDNEAMDDHFFSAGSEDFHSLKNYVPGDSVHRFHWPSFSRDQLMVKAFTDYQTSDETIAWEQFPGVPTEARLAAIEFFAEEFNKKQQPFSVKLPGLDINVDKGPEHLNRVKRALAEYGYV